MTGIKCAGPKIFAVISDGYSFSADMYWIIQSHRKLGINISKISFYSPRIPVDFFPPLVAKLKGYRLLQKLLSTKKIFNKITRSKIHKFKYDFSTEY